MGEILSSGLEVNASYTGADPRQTGNEAQRQHIVTLSTPEETGDQPIEMSMERAVHAVYRALRNPEVARSPVVEQYVQQLKSYRPRAVSPDEMNRGGEFSDNRLLPSMGVTLHDIELDIDRASQENGAPVITLFNQPFSRADVIRFSSYILSYTALEDTNDPRLKLIETLRKEALAGQPNPAYRRRALLAGLLGAGVAAAVIFSPHGRGSQKPHKSGKTSETHYHAIPFPRITIPLQHIRVSPGATSLRAHTHVPGVARHAHQQLHTPKSKPSHTGSKPNTASAPTSHPSQVPGAVPSAPVHSVTSTRGERHTYTYHPPAPEPLTTGGGSLQSTPSSTLSKPRPSRQTHAPGSGGVNTNPPHPDRPPIKRTGGTKIGPQPAPKSGTAGGGVG